MPCDHLYRVSPKQVVRGGGAGGRPGCPLAWAALRLLCLCQVVPAGGSSALSISFTPEVLGPSVLHKVKCMGYALGFMSLDDEVSPTGPGWGPRPLPVHPRDRSNQAPWAGRWKGSSQGGGGARRASPWNPCGWTC